MVTPGHFRTRLTGNTPPEIEQKMIELIPRHRFGDPLEIGYAVAMLLSDRLSGYTHGAELVVDGGLTLRPLPLLSEEEIQDLNINEEANE
jgi:glucose 1-dehydrogenase